MARMLPQKLGFFKMLLFVGSALAISPTKENLPPQPKEGGVTTQYCEFYNGSKICDPKNSTNCVPAPPEREECRPTETDKSNHCFVLWQFDNVTNTGVPKVKGCFLDTVSCTDRVSNCRLHNVKLPLLHCCCEGDMCNQNLTFPGLEPVTASPLPTGDDDTKSSSALAILTEDLPSRPYEGGVTCIDRAIYTIWRILQWLQNLRF